MPAEATQSEAPATPRHGINNASSTAVASKSLSSLLFGRKARSPIAASAADSLLGSRATVGRENLSVAPIDHDAVKAGMLKYGRLNAPYRLVLCQKINQRQATFSRAESVIAANLVMLLFKSCALEYSRPQQRLSQNSRPREYALPPAHQ